MFIPYVATGETYQGADRVSPLFPIAIADNGSPAVIRWAEYNRDRSKYREKLLVNVEGGTYPIGRTEVLTITRRAPDSFALTLDTDDYTFWCEYTIENGTVQPRSFRYSGASVVFYASLVAAIGTAIFGWIRRRYMTNRSSATS